MTDQLENKRIKCIGCLLTTYNLIRTTFISCLHKTDYLKRTT